MNTGSTSWLRRIARIGASANPNGQPRSNGGRMTSPARLEARERWQRDTDWAILEQEPCAPRRS